jgi:hypothetical protein
VKVGTGVFVGAGGLVGAEVFVGLGVLVDAGANVSVGWTDIGVRVAVDACEKTALVADEKAEIGASVRLTGVALMNRVGVFDGVGVHVGVMVGVAEMRGVIVAVGVGVFVGRVAVGKGPISAWTVAATAVLVLSASCILSCKLNAFEFLKKRM